MSVGFRPFDRAKARPRACPESREARDRRDEPQERLPPSCGGGERFISHDCLQSIVDLLFKNLKVVAWQDEGG
jgi:hypothetical protein